MRRLLRGIAILAVAGAALAGTARAAPPEGDWMGVMKTPTLGDLTLALHLRKTADGYAGTLDDVTLGYRDLPLKAVTASPERLAFDAPTAHGHYEATWDAAKGQWDGAWTSPGVEQGVPLNLAPGAPPPPPLVQGLDGDWQGSLNVGAAGLMRLVVHVRTGAGRTGQGGTHVTLDSLDQGASAPASGIRRTGRDVEIDFPLLKAQFAGELSDDGAVLQGEFAQGPALYPLVLRRGGDVPAPPRAKAGAGPLPDDAAIRQLLARRIDTERRSVGIVVGLISPTGRRIIAHGAADTPGGRPADGDTLFEIGSVTKTFTALLLQDMALRGQVGLDDPAVKALPAGTQLPSFEGRPITLRELATHTSALPRDLPSADPKQPLEGFAHGDAADAYRFLATYALPRAPGAQWDYSNLGVGLEGLAISHVAGADYQTVLRQRITGPLGMASTVAPATLSDLPAALRARLATGHDAYLRPTAPLAIGPAEAAAGVIRSSANDMLSYLAAETGLTPSPLKPAMDAMLAKDVAGEAGGFRQALGWMVLDLPDGRIVTHSGGTFGQRAFAAFNPKTRRGVIVLSNAEGATGADDIGLYIIAGVPVPPLPPAPPPPQAGSARPEIALGAEAARAYLGRYRMSRSIVLVIGYADGHLTCAGEARGVAGPATPMAWHGGEDFSTANGGGEPVGVTFQKQGPQASAFTWRGPAGEFVLKRIAG